MKFLAWVKLTETPVCYARTFHQKCDNQGPTVTVLYNQQGSVYGGYTSYTWETTDGYYDDLNAFLYQLHFNKSPTARKFPSKNNGYGIYKNGGYGPTFGGNHNVCAFTGIVIYAGDYFALNEPSNIGYGYDTQGVYGNQYYTGNINFDLCAFSGTVNNSGGFFALNGSLNIGYGYDAQGVNGNQINNGNMNVVELEVYKVSGKFEKDVIN
jgi:hypothetical protein